MLQPRQVAALKAIARKEKASWTLLQQDRAALDDLHATAEQRAKWRQMSDEDLPVPNMPLLAAAGEKAVAVLTPEQLEKLDNSSPHSKLSAILVTLPCGAKRQSACEKCEFSSPAALFCLTVPGHLAILLGSL